ncbi:hypothetical protein INT43_003052 [Umbelopsis isabellina]|uniref:Uncharacterized protein n=1 Tax=Mortierella isabellina TaxID=91625 RepID=A0A8H7PPZ6_MORIS|nr:hypothetical protein INT43_003052 [Umbelopsis isabellina]
MYIKHLIFAVIAVLLLANGSIAAPAHYVKPCMYEKQMADLRLQSPQETHYNLNQENSAIATYIDPSNWPEPQPQKSFFDRILEMIWQIPRELLTPPADYKERFGRSSRNELDYAEWLVEITL